jgi:hypothetical protein
LAKASFYPRAVAQGRAVADRGLKASLWVTVAEGAVLRAAAADGRQQKGI